MVQKGKKCGEGGEMGEGESGKKRQGNKKGTNIGMMGDGSL